jgi:hypothetical protein
MKNSSNREKIRAVSKAAIWGAAVFIATIVLDHLAGSMTNYDTSNFFWENISELLGIFVFIETTLSEFVMNTIGFHDYSNPYILYIQFIADGLMGAFFFAVIAGIWQFVVKRGQKSNC